MNYLKTGLIVLITLLSSNSVLGQINAGMELDEMIKKGMEDWKIPGLTTIVVKNDEVVFSKTYGVRDLASGKPVDEHTLFAMASTTKAITSMALGILVDQGKLAWTDKVRDHLPSFQLSDPYITEEARVQDLLTHNLGIAGADLLWAIDSTSAEEIIERFKYAEKVYPLRGDYIYNNIMYVIAGEIIKAVSGEDWATFVTKNILLPLEMTHTKTRSTGVFEGNNYVTPYLNDIDEGVIQVKYSAADQIGPAGSLWSSAGDMENYLKFLTNDGVFNADTLLSAETFDYLFKPHSIIPSLIYPTLSLTKTNWTTYGLGWFQHDYRGVKLDFHTGSLMGLTAIAGIMREKDLAVYVFANMDHAELRHAILYKAMDLYAFNDDSRDWNREVFDLYDEFRKKQIESNEKLIQDRVTDTRPSLDWKEYEGLYRHKMLGSIEVNVKGEMLELNINDFAKVQASHWHYETFRSDKNNRYKMNMMFNFIINQSGMVEELILVSAGPHFLGEKFNKIPNN